MPTAPATPAAETEDTRPQQLAYVDPDARVWLVNADGSNQTLLIEDCRGLSRGRHATSPYELAWDEAVHKGTGRDERLWLQDLQLPSLVHPVPKQWAAYGLAWRFEAA